MTMNGIGAAAMVGGFALAPLAVGALAQGIMHHSDLPGLARRPGGTKSHWSAAAMVSAGALGLGTLGLGILPKSASVYALFGAALVSAGGLLAAGVKELTRQEPPSPEYLHRRMLHRSQFDS